MLLNSSSCSSNLQFWFRSSEMLSVAFGVVPWQLQFISISSFFLMIALKKKTTKKPLSATCQNLPHSHVAEGCTPEGQAQGSQRPHRSVPYTMPGCHTAAWRLGDPPPLTPPHVPGRAIKPCSQHCRPYLPWDLRVR